MAKSKQKKPARGRYTNGNVWITNKAGRVFRAMKKFKKYKFPENLKAAADGALVLLRVRKLASANNIDLSEQL